MSLLEKLLKPILLSLASASLLLLSSCGESAVPPTAEQTAELTRMVSACVKIEGKQRLDHLPEFRKKYGGSFTCEDVQQACSVNYAGDECASAKTEIAIETAFEKACRRSQSASNSSACRKLGEACNRNGFQSNECTAAVRPYLSYLN